MDSSSSRGFEYLPEAFSGLPHELGSMVAGQAAFQQIFEHYLYSVTLNSRLLVYFRGTVLQGVIQIVGPRLFSLERLTVSREHKQLLVQTTWCAVCLVTDEHFDQVGRLGCLNEKQLGGLLSGWYDLLALAFLPANGPRTVNSTKVINWSAKYLLLNDLRTFEVDARIKRLRTALGWETLDWTDFVPAKSQVSANLLLERDEYWARLVRTERSEKQSGEDL
ncbi:MAG TPA: hypothetical protein V6D22_15060 [Candidatus Obscuribacterales bacterium]